MHQVTLQAYTYRNMADRAGWLHDSSQLAHMIVGTFSDPSLLNESFKQNLYKFNDRRCHNVDLDFIGRFFEDVEAGRILTASELLGTAEVLLNRISSGTTPKDNFLRIYFMLLLNVRLLLPENVEVFKTLVRHIELLTSESREGLARWLCDLDGQRFSQMVSMVQLILTKQVMKLLPSESLDDMDPITITDTIHSCCFYLELIHRSNEIKARLDQHHFKNESVMRHFDPAEQFKLNYKGIHILNFVMYPFLLNIDYKNRLLEIQTRVEHHISMQRGLANMINGVIDEELKPNQTIANAMFFMLQINRDTILDDSIEKLSRTKRSLRNPLKVTFLGEPGDDGGGVKKEYFQLLMKEIFNPNRDLFVTKGNGTLRWFNSQTFQAPMMFEFLGIILGLSIYNTTLLELQFPKLLYKKLLLRQGQQLNLVEELQEIEPDFYKSFKYLLDTQDSLDSLEMTFEAESQSYGVRTTHLLKPYGNLIAVSQANKHEYVQLYADWLINKSIEKEFTAFKRGFDKVVTSTVIKLFSAEELERVICGCQTLDFNQLQTVVRYDGGYSERSNVIRWLWDILHGCDLIQKKAFLFFVTGSDRAPIQGLSSLKMTIQRESDSDNLPSSRTCSSVLLLPDYCTRDKLREKLLLALQFKESFGLI